MSGRDGRGEDPLGQLIVATIVVISVVAVLFGAHSRAEIQHRRGVIEQSAQHHCSKADAQGCEDLKSDIRSANAAADAVDVAIWQVALNLLGLIGLGFTVVYARRASIASRNAADHAARSNELTRSTTRAWMEFIFEVEGIADQKTRDGFINIRIKSGVKNVGQLPASGVVVAISDVQDTKALLEYGREGVRTGYISPDFPGNTVFPGREQWDPGSRHIPTRIPDASLHPFDVWFGGYIDYYIDAKREERRTTPFVYIIEFHECDDSGRYTKYKVTPHFYQIAPT